MPLKIESLIARATERPWFKRFCDDEDNMCMTVISSKDYGPNNTSQFGDEPDTVAIVFHQIRPSVSHELADFGDGNTELITTLANSADELVALVKAAWELDEYITADEQSLAHAHLREALYALTKRAEWREEGE